MDTTPSAMSDPAQTTAWAILPHEGRPVVHRIVGGGEPVPIAALPFPWGVQTALSADGRFVAVLDPTRRSAVLYGLNGDTGDRHTVLPPAPLPGEGHALVTHGDVLYVGGRGKQGEMLWLRHPEHAPQWQAVPLSLPRYSGAKAVDGLHVRGNHLIAVDDLISPKWTIVLDIERPERPKVREVIDLPIYGRVFGTALGPDYLAVLSRGFNHGIACVALTLLDVRTLQGAAEWVYLSDREGEADQADWLRHATAVAWVKTTLLVALGPAGLIALEVGASGARTTFSSEPEPWGIPGLDVVEAVVVPDPGSAGMAVVGRNGTNDPSYVWLSSSSLQRPI